MLVFTALALAFGVVLAGFVARLSTWLPLPSTARATVVRYLPVAAVAAFGFSVTFALVLLGVLVVVATRWTRLLDAVRSPMAIRSDVSRSSRSSRSRSLAPSRASPTS